jgi:hypothetical protein
MQVIRTVEVDSKWVCVYFTTGAPLIMLWPDVYAAGLRVIITTANMVYADCNNKTQGLWWQVGAKPSD